MKTYSDRVRRKVFLKLPYGVKYETGVVLTPNGWGLESYHFNPRSVISFYTARDYGPWRLERKK